MKKQYIKPTMDVYDIKPSQMLCNSPVNVSVYTGDSENIDDPVQVW
jgi:hypothetical protein